MKKFLVTIVCFAMLISACATVSLVKKPATITESVELVGLDFHGKPCGIQVPAELPLDFIMNANDLIIQQDRFDGFCIIVFASLARNLQYIITVWATTDCANFMAMDLYHFDTEDSKMWLWNFEGEVREVTDDQYQTFINNLTSAIAAKYCPKSVPQGKI